MKKPVANLSTQKAFIDTFQQRFQSHRHRHPHVPFDTVLSTILAHPQTLNALIQMEGTGGEPDVLALSMPEPHLVMIDFSKESPSGRRSLCYDAAALSSRKENKPKHSALGLAEEMGVRLVDEALYRKLQQIEPVDTKTSSWLLTPKSIRDLGGAIFGDYRYGQAFIYHNGAESYYAARGFRAYVRI